MPHLGGSRPQVDVLCGVERTSGFEHLWSKRDSSRYLVMEKMMDILTSGSC